MKCCETELLFVQTDVSVSQAQCSKCSTCYQKRYLDPNSKVYKTTNEGSDWFCTTCGSEIQGVTVLHPIHDGPFPLSGSGKVATEMVPYCPQCEKPPSSHGSFITKD